MQPTNKHIFEDEKISVLITEDGKNPNIEITDKINGKQWGQSPVLELEVFDRPCDRVERLEHLRVDLVEKVPNGIHMMVSSDFYSVEVGIWVRVYDGELSITLQPSEFYERRPDLHRIFAINILPGIFDVGPQGSLLLPIQTGMVTSPGNKPKIEDRFLIYLEQNRWELCPLLPVAAAWDEEGGMAIIATQGACDAECRVATDGQGKGHVGFAASLRRNWYEPVDFDLREFCYRPIPKEKDPVSFTAKRLRQHIIKDLKKPTLKERVKESPELAYMVDAYIMKLFHAVEVGERPGEVRPAPSFKNHMTFKEASSSLKRLHDAGIEKVLAISVGWHAGGGDGLFPTRFPIDERLGGEKEFQKFVASGNALGYNVTVHDNYMMNTPKSPDWNPEYLIHDVAGEPLCSGCWACGLDFESWPLAFPDGLLEKEMRRIQALGVKGTYYLDYIMRPLEVNFHPRHRGPRSHHALGMQKVIETAKRIFGSVEVEFGTLPAAITADCVVTYGSQYHLNNVKPEWPISNLMGDLVPVWQLALSGLTLVEQSGYPTWQGAMRAILFGHKLRDEWHSRPGPHGCLDESRIKAQKACYDLCIKGYSFLGLEELVESNKAGDNLYINKFADGTEVTADFEKLELFVNGKNIPMPKALQNEKMKVEL
jgi:hypothetical protein